jgi:hypothetical protein
VTHIFCAVCTEWQGNVGPDGPIGWHKLLYSKRPGWFWDHGCGRIVIHADKLPTILAKERVRRHPISIG